MLPGKLFCSRRAFKEKYEVETSEREISTLHVRSGIGHSGRGASAESAASGGGSQGTMDGQEPVPGPAGRYGAEGDDAGRKDPVGAWNRLGCIAAGRSGSTEFELWRWVYRRSGTAGDPRYQRGRLCGRRENGRARKPLCDPAAFRTWRGGQLGSARRAALWAGDWAGAAGAGIQHVDRRRCRPDARAAQRPQLRVRGRRPGARGHHGRQSHEGRCSRSRSWATSSTTRSTTRRRGATL